MIRPTNIDRSEHRSEPDEVPWPENSTADNAAAARSMPDGAGSALSRSGAARRTAGCEAPPTTSENTNDESMELRRMLAIPRPTTRGECLQEARPCPWAGCRHHLLLDVAEAKPRTPRDGRPTSLRLANRGERVNGRPPGLAPSATELEVDAWIDDAVATLSSMPETCALDVAMEHGGLRPKQIGELLGVSEQRIDTEAREAGVVAAHDMRSYRDHVPVDHASGLAHAQDLMAGGSVGTRASKHGRGRVDHDAVAEARSENLVEERVMPPSKAVR